MGRRVETRGRPKDGNEDGKGDGNESTYGDDNVDYNRNGAGRITGSGRLEGRRISASNRTREVVDAMWETGET